MQSPLVSVIMPVYNSEEYLEEAIDSILSQTYRSFELIIIDDNSSNNTWERVLEFAQKDSRILAIKNKKNLGIAANRNEGIRSSKGEFIANMDHDDVSLPDRFKQQVEFLNNNPEYAAVGGQVQIINEKSEVIGNREYQLTNDEISNQISMKSPMCNPSTMLRKKVLLDLGYYDTQYPGVEDYDMWFKILNEGWKLSNLPEVCLRYRVTSNQQKSQNLKSLLTYSQAVQRKWIFKKNFKTLPGVFQHLLRYLLFLIPNNIILYVFKKISYKS